MSLWFSPAHIAGMLCILVGAADHWLAHDGFGLQWNEALILAGLAWLGGVAVPSPVQAVSR